ncbi:MAG: SNF2-related protein, partial [Arenicellales bacterium]
MNKPHTLLNGDLRQIFGNTYFKRGEAYFKGGLVLKQRNTSNKRNHVELESRVMGSDPYAQTITIRWDQNNQLIDIIGNCNCPVRFNCKHVVAVCLDFRDSLRKTPNKTKATSQNDDQGDNFAWLKDVQQSGDAVTSTKDQTDIVLYLLSQTRVKQPIQVELKVARQLKKGGMGVARNAVLNNIAHPYMKPAYANMLDVEIAQLIMAADNDHWQSKKNLRHAAGALALEKMLESGRCYWESLKSSPLQLGTGRTLDIFWKDEPNNQLSLQLRAGKHTELILTDPPCYIDTVSLEIGELDVMGLNPEQLQQLIDAPVLASSQAQAFSRLLVKKYSHLGIPTPRKIEVTKIAGVLPIPQLKLSKTKHKDALTRSLSLQFKYQDWVLSAAASKANPSDITLLDENDKLIEIEHHIEQETTALIALKEAGFVPAQLGDHKEMMFIAPFAEDSQEGIAFWADFVDKQIPELEVEGWEISLQDNFNLEIYEAEDYWGDIEEESHDWFNLRLDVEVNGQRVSLLKLLLPLLHQFEPDQLPDTLYIPLDENQFISAKGAEIRPYMQTLYELFDSVDINQESLRISRYDSALLSELETETNLRWQGGDFLRELGAKLKDFSGITPCPVPEGFLGELRDYQEAGLSWLAFLREYQLNGILADDMGLGKTVQTIAHILTEKLAGRLDLPVLVIAPTSLMGNWRREIESFAPELNTVVLQGPDRKQFFEDIASSDVVLTTYPLLPRDAETLLKQKYHLAVLDEAQLVKNPRAKAAQIVRKLNTRHRLCLTGTPMENHLGELWTQFDFLMPGFLGNLKTFKRVYQTPIEKHGDVETGAKLARRVAPFMLRRKKDEVEKELPPKTEMIRSVPLGKGQAALYETIRLSMEFRVREAIADKGLARSHITILDALL